MRNYNDVTTFEFSSCCKIQKVQISTNYMKIPKYSLNVVSLALARSDTILSTITEMIAIKTYNSKIKSETKVPKVYSISPIVLFAGFFEGDACSIFVR